MIITIHAVDRIKERFSCNENKIPKIVLKAWKSKDVISKKTEAKFNIRTYRNDKYKNSHYRFFQGFVFVFVTEHGDNKLVTVFHPWKEQIDL